MKEYSTDIMKLITLLVITPILVMIYINIEKSFVATPADQSQGGASGATPVSIGLIGKLKSVTILPFEKNNHLLFEFPGPIVGAGAKETNFTENSVAANDF